MLRAATLWAGQVALRTRSFRPEERVHTRVMQVDPLADHTPGPGLRCSSARRDSRWVPAASGAPGTLSRVGNPSPKQVSLTSKYPADLGRPVSGFWRSKPPVPFFYGVPRAWVARNRDLLPDNPHGRVIRSSLVSLFVGALTGGTSQLLSRSWSKNKN